MELSVAIPASLVSDVPHLREKTSRIGMIGRALAIFRVSEVIVYPDKSFENQRHEAELISTLLSYMEAPQYLRKHLFPIMPALRYASILPPLRTPNHPLTKRISDLKTGDYRDGVIVKTGKETLVDIGVEHPIRLNEGNLPIGQRITVNVHKHKLKINVKKVETSEITNIYWGYRVNISDLTIGKILKDKIRDFVVLTSRYGKLLTEVAEEFKSRCGEAHKVLIAFGSPKQGLREILEYEGYRMEDIDALVINTVPKQGTKTVRTEEAVYATLAIINIII